MFLLKRAFLHGGAGFFLMSSAAGRWSSQSRAISSAPTTGSELLAEALSATTAVEADVPHPDLPSTSAVVPLEHSSVGVDGDSSDIRLARALRRLCETLPVGRAEQVLRDRLRSSFEVEVVGSTGCGKSTCIPLLLLQDATRAPQSDRPLIWVTQPTRLACRRLADYVASLWKERVGPGGVVGYAVSRQHAVDWDCVRLLFTTPSYAAQYLLHHTTKPLNIHLVVDEAHCRDVDTDLLIAWARCQRPNIPNSAAQPNRRQQLRVVQLVIMSATMNLDAIHPTCPADVVNIDQYAPEVKQRSVLYVGDLAKYPCSLLPSTKRTLYEAFGTAFDSLQSGFNSRAYDAVAKLIASCLSSKRNVLVFLPGIAEIVSLHSALKQYFSPVSVVAEVREADPSSIAFVGPYRVVSRAAPEWSFPRDELVDIVLLHSSEIGESTQQLDASNAATKIFLATNVAESSVTLPDVATVIDFGTERIGVCTNTGHVSLLTRFCSRGSLEQRRGRAGRTVQNPLIIHLFSKFVQQRMRACQPSEVSDAGVQKLILRLKYLFPHFQSASAVASLLAAMPEPPTLACLESAAAVLHAEGILTSSKLLGSQLSPLGQYAAALPLSLANVRLVVVGLHLGMVVDAVMLAAAFTVPDITAQQRAEDGKNFMTARREQLKASHGELSDVVATLSFLRLWFKSGSSDLRKIAAAHSMNYSKLQTVDVLVANVCERLLMLLDLSPTMPWTATLEDDYTARRNFWDEAKLALRELRAAVNAHSHARFEDANRTLPAASLQRVALLFFAVFGLRHALVGLSPSLAGGVSQRTLELTPSVDPSRCCIVKYHPSDPLVVPCVTKKYVESTFVAKVQAAQQTSSDPQLFSQVSVLPSKRAVLCQIGAPSPPAHDFQLCKLPESPDRAVAVGSEQTPAADRLFLPPQGLAYAAFLCVTQQATFPIDPDADTTTPPLEEPRDSQGTSVGDKDGGDDDVEEDAREKQQPIAAESFVAPDSSKAEVRFDVKQNELLLVKSDNTVLLRIRRDAARELGLDALCPPTAVLPLYSADGTCCATPKKIPTGNVGGDDACTTSGGVTTVRFGCPVLPYTVQWRAHCNNAAKSLLPPSSPSSESAKKEMPQEYCPLCYILSSADHLRTPRHLHLLARAIENRLSLSIVTAIAPQRSRIVDATAPAPVPTSQWFPSFINHKSPFTVLVSAPKRTLPVMGSAALFRQQTRNEQAHCVAYFTWAASLPFSLGTVLGYVVAAALDGETVHLLTDARGETAWAVRAGRLLPVPLPCSLGVQGISLLRDVVECAASLFHHCRAESDAFRRAVTVLAKHIGVRMSTNAETAQSIRSLCKQHAGYWWNVPRSALTSTRRTIAGDSLPPALPPSLEEDLRKAGLNAVIKNWMVFVESMLVLTLQQAVEAQKHRAYYNMLVVRLMEHLPTGKMGCAASRAVLGGKEAVVPWRRF